MCTVIYRNRDHRPCFTLILVDYLRFVHIRNVYVRMPTTRYSHVYHGVPWSSLRQQKTKCSPLFDCLVCFMGIYVRGSLLMGGKCCRFSAVENSQHFRTKSCWFVTADFGSDYANIKIKLVHKKAGDFDLNEIYGSGLSSVRVPNHPICTSNIINAKVNTSLILNFI